MSEMSGAGSGSSTTGADLPRPDATVFASDMQGVTQIPGAAAAAATPLAVEPVGLQTAVGVATPAAFWALQLPRQP